MSVPFKTLTDLLPEVKKDLVERGELPKYPLTTLSGFSHKIWGLPRKGLLIIGGRTSQGKSSLVLQLAQDIASQDKPVLLLSLEMDTHSLIERLFCQKMKIDNFEILKGKLMEYDSEWEEFCVWIKKIPLLITCGIGKTFQEVNDFIAILNPKPQIVIVDYIQSIRQLYNEREQLNEYIRLFKELMIKNNMLGILVSQINRRIIEQENKFPTLENLKGTGVLEEHSNMVILLFWEWFYTRNDAKKNNYKFIIAKNSGGRTGEYEIEFLPEYYLFREIQKQKEFSTEDIKKIKDIFGGEEMKGA